MLKEAILIHPRKQPITITVYPLPNTTRLFMNTNTRTNPICNLKSGCRKQATNESKLLSNSPIPTWHEYDIKGIRVAFMENGCATYLTQSLKNLLDSFKTIPVPINDMYQGLFSTQSFVLVALHMSQHDIHCNIIHNLTGLEAYLYVCMSYNGLVIGLNNG